MTEKFTNLVVLALAAPCGSGDATITLITGEGALLPPTGTFRLEVEAEIMVGTLTTGDVVSVNRAQEGTAAAAHAAGTTVIPGLTAGAITQLKADIEAAIGTITAAEVTFDDTVDAPTTGAVNVQEALDYFKSHPSLPITVVQGGTGLTGTGAVGKVLGVTSPGVLGYVTNASSSSLQCTLFVAEGGNDTTGDGSMNAPFATYSKAAATAAASSTPSSGTPWLVVFAPGGYAENIELQANVFLANWDTSENCVTFFGNITLGSTFSSGPGECAISNSLITGNISLSFNPSFPQGMEFYGCFAEVGSFTATGGGSGQSEAFFFNSIFLMTMTATDVNFYTVSSSFTEVVLSASSHTSTFESYYSGGSITTLTLVGGTAGHTVVAQNTNTAIAFLTLNGTLATYTGTVDGAIPYEAGQPVLTGGALISQYTILGEIPPANVGSAGVTTGYVLTSAGGVTEWAPATGGMGGGISNVLWIAENGNDTTGTGSFSLPFATYGKCVTAIGSAATATNPYTVMAGPGTYSEALLIAPWIFLSGFDPAQTTVFTSTLGLSSAWTGATTPSSGFANLVIEGGVSWDWNVLGVTGGNVTIINSNLSPGGTFLPQGPGGSVTMRDCQCVNPMGFLTVSAVTSGCTFATATIEALSGAVTWVSDGDYFGALTVLSAGHTAAMTANGSGISGVLTLNGTLATLHTTLSGVPGGGTTLAGSASIGQLTILGELPPANIQPSGTNGWVLTTTTGVAIWAAPSGAGGSGIANVLWVAENGDDTAGTGTFDLPYATYGKCVSAIGSAATASNPYTVVFGPGTYAENPIQLAPFINLIGFDTTQTTQIYSGPLVAQTTILTGSLTFGTGFTSAGGIVTIANLCCTNGGSSAATFTYSSAVSQTLIISNVTFQGGVSALGAGNVSFLQMVNVNLSFAHVASLQDMNITASNCIFANGVVIASITGIVIVQISGGYASGNVQLNATLGHNLDTQFFGGFTAPVTVNGALAFLSVGIGEIPLGLTFTGGASASVNYSVTGEVPPANVDATGITTGFVLTATGGVAGWAAAGGGGGGGITQLTGDGVAGPGSGSQALTVERWQNGVGVFDTAGTVTWSAAATPQFRQSTTTSATGATMSFFPQNSTAGSATGGNFNIFLQAPTGAGSEAAFIVSRGGTTCFAAGPYPAAGSSFHGIWLHQSSVGNTNYSLLGDGVNTLVNAASGTIFFLQTNVTMATMSPSVLGLAVGMNFNVGNGSTGGGAGVVALGNASALPTYANTSGMILGAAGGAFGGIHAYGPPPNSAIALTDEIIAPAWQAGGGTLTTQAGRRMRFSFMCNTTTNSGVTAGTVPCAEFQTVTMLIMFLGGRQVFEQPSGQVAIYVQASFTNVGGTPVGATTVPQFQIAKTYDALYSTATFSLVPVSGGIELQPVGVSFQNIPWEVFVDAFYI